MAKNYASIYNGGNDAIAIEQRVYAKEETIRGDLIAPTGADFLFTLAGGSIDFTQPFESSPYRSGRGHLNIIKKKKECNWNFSSYFDIDTTLGAAGVAEISPAFRLLCKSLFGAEDTTSGLQYTRGTPSITMTIFEVGDLWARQVRGGFVQEANWNFPGDAEATAEWSGSAKDAFIVGIGKTTVDNNTTNDVVLEAGDGERFEQAVGAYVMLVEADGVTRSADTPDGSPRKITAVVGDTVTVDGAPLADADGSAADIYLVYYEPESPTAINDPQVGLEGSISITGLASQCIRNMSLAMANNHELQNYCFGEDSLAGKFFIPGDRFTSTLTMEMNLNAEVLKFFKSIEAFESQVIELILGDSAGRHLDVDIPKAFFPIPSFSVPETGSIPVTFEGTAYQTALDADDEISAHFK